MNNCAVGLLTITRNAHLDARASKSFLREPAGVACVGDEWPARILALQLQLLHWPVLLRGTISQVEAVVVVVVVVVASSEPSVQETLAWP